MSIKTRGKALNFGEVFTSEREVNAMLDLVYNEAEKIDSRFLEPTCDNSSINTKALLNHSMVLQANIAGIRNIEGG